MNQTPIELREMDVVDLKGWSNNPREISVAAMDGLRASVERFGVVAPIIWNAKTDRVVSGHQRLRVLKEKGVKSVKVIVIDIEEKDEKFLNIALNNQAITGDFTDGVAKILEDLRRDDSILFAALKMSDIVENLDLTLSANDMALITGKISMPDIGPVNVADIKKDEIDEEDPKGDSAPVPDALFTSDNEWGIPTLDLNKQARYIEHPILHWHDFRQRMVRLNLGTVHMYIDDSYFSNLWENPNFVFDSCKSITEPNFSTNLNFPRVIVLYTIYKKRWLARYWQERGCKIFVDTFVDPVFRDLILIGVPNGWKAYSTRYATSMAPQKYDEIVDMVYERAGTKKDIVFFVYGGGKKGIEFCKKYGFTYVEDSMNAKMEARKQAQPKKQQKEEVGKLAT